MGLLHQDGGSLRLVKDYSLSRDPVARTSGDVEPVVTVWKYFPGGEEIQTLKLERDFMIQEKRPVNNGTRDRAPRVVGGRRGHDSRGTPGMEVLVTEAVASSSTRFSKAKERATARSCNNLMVFCI